MADYDSRLNDLENEAFKRAVTEATAKVSQSLAQIHRRRLVSYTAAIVALIMIMFGGGTYYLVQQSAKSHTKADIRYVCNVVRDISNPIADFITTDANLRIKQANQALSGETAKGFEKIFSKNTLARLAAKSNRESLAVANRWKNKDAPQVRHIGGINCNI